MASEFDKLLLASFDGVQFPIKDSEVKGGLRDHTHEYWKRDGGDNEKGGRKNYLIHITARFDARFLKYAGLWPDRLDRLLRTFEQGVTADLVHPTRGTIRCYCVDWTTRMTASVRSGEEVTLDFKQDTVDLFTIELTEPTSTNIRTGASVLAARLALAEVPPDAKSIFDKIHDAANTVIAIRDTADAYGQLVTAKVLGLAALCQKADALLFMQDASYYPITEALHDLWSAAIKLAQDVQSKHVTLTFYTVVATASMNQIAIAIYGNTAKLAELQSLNAGAVRDPSRIPAGTRLVYYPAA